MKKYGLQLRIPPSQQSKKAAATKPTLPPAALGFGAGDSDDEDDAEKQIARQAAKNRARKEIEEQHNKALAEDPSIFDYDAAYDEMKEKSSRPLIQDRTERKSKYIEKLKEKAKEREREHEIIYEKKLLKERSKEDHLYAGKEKFVTSAYKKKLAEQAKWLEEERLRELREEKEDVTKKADLSDFYFNLTKNVAFGALKDEPRKSVAEENAPSEPKARTDGPREPAKEERRLLEGETITESKAPEEVGDQTQASPSHQNDLKTTETVPGSVVQGTTSVPVEAKSEETVADQERYKRSQDALAAAKERYLARKRERKQ